MTQLKLSSDRKVAPKSRINGKSQVPEIKNAFGLPAHLSCPGATSVCRDTCYAFRLERAYSNVDKLLRHNLQLLMDRRRSVTSMKWLLEDLIARFNEQHDRLEAKHGKEFPRVFRIHWDGDFFSTLYARAWALVIAENPHVRFWAYTRSFTSKVNVVPHLANLDNLTLYLSVDNANQKRAKKVKEENPWVKVAYLGTDWENAAEGVQIVINKKAPRCPENTGKYPLVSESGEGACVKCMLCVNGTNDVLFAIDKS